MHQNPLIKLLIEFKADVNIADSSVLAMTRSIFLTNIELGYNFVIQTSSTKS